MKAIFEGKLFSVVDDNSDGLILERKGMQITVEYGDETLIVDPTDSELEEHCTDEMPLLYQSKSLN